jgi:hypothetical protein
LKGAPFIHLLEGRGKINAKEIFASILKREIIIDEISKVRIYKKGKLRKEINLVKNQSFKYSKEFLNKTIQVWQPYSPTPLSLNDAREITGNMTALFNFLITGNININKNKEGKNAKREI